MRQVGADELVGRTLGEGEYRLVARLGGGGMGAVYEADQTRLRRRVAVKVLWPHLTQEPGLVVRFNREARIAARLEHPHILPIYGFGEESGLLYLVMRLVRGGSLKDRLRGEGLRRQGWSPREALELARQALPPLDYAHRQGVVHRDLKPDNILLEPSDEFSTGYRAFLSDFGIATLAQGDEVDSGLTQTGNALGTPAYMAPEQVLDQHVDGRADLYAFGVMLFEVLVGQVPYRGHTPLGLAMQHVREPVPSARELNPGLPSSVEAVLFKALEKNPEDRFRSGMALIEALAQAVERSETESQAVPSRRGRAEAARPMRPTPPPEPPPRAGDLAGEPAHSPSVADLRPLSPVDSPGVAPAGARGAGGQVEGTASRVEDTHDVRPNEPRVERQVAGPGRGILVLAGLVLLLGALAGAGGMLASGAFTAAQQETPTPVADLASPPSSSVVTPRDPRGWVVPPSDLGPGWTVKNESIAGSTPQLAVYEVEYTEVGVSPDTTGFSLFSASTVADAEAGQQQLRQSAEASGHVFTSVAGFAQGSPAERGRGILAGDSSRVSIVYLFRVNTTVAIVEALGPADQEATISSAAEHAAQLQRDRLLNGSI